MPREPLGAAEEHDEEQQCFDPGVVLAAIEGGPHSVSQLQLEQGARLVTRLVSYYWGAVAKACQKAGVPRWAPNQLRHNCGTKVRRLYGLDAAAAVLGHRLGTVTEVYAEADLRKAIDVMREIG